MALILQVEKRSQPQETEALIDFVLVRNSNLSEIINAFSDMLCFCFSVHIYHNEKITHVTTIQYLIHACN